MWKEFPEPESHEWSYLTAYRSDSLHVLQTESGLTCTRQNSLYSLVHDSSDELKMCQTRKKPDICVFFSFFLRHADMPRSISVKKWAKSARKCPTRKKKSDLSNFFYIFFSPTWLKNYCRDSWTKEYSECCTCTMADFTCMMDRVILYMHYRQSRTLHTLWTKPDITCTMHRVRLNMCYGHHLCGSIHVPD